MKAGREPWMHQAQKIWHPACHFGTALVLVFMLNVCFGKGLDEALIHSANPYDSIQSLKDSAASAQTSGRSLQAVGRGLLQADPQGTSVSGIATRVAVGALHTCVAESPYKVVCMGNNEHGQLGIGNTDDAILYRTLPGPAVDLGTNTYVQQIVAGANHTCVILAPGRLKCWGLNDLGQLGLGHTDSIGLDPDSMGDNLAFVDVGEGAVVVAVTAGRAHTCVLLADDRVLCWGANAVGQLGAGDQLDRGGDAQQMGSGLQPVDFGEGLTAVSISAGQDHTCAQLNNGQVKCWGYNGPHGCLGQGQDWDVIGTAQWQLGDDLTAVDLGTGRSCVKIVAGALHTCALLDDASIKCWGGNEHGELGQGHTNHLGNLPTQLGDQLPAVRLGTDADGKPLEAVDVVAGAHHTCATFLSSDQKIVKCWGENQDGSLGLQSEFDVGDVPSGMQEALPALQLGTELRLQGVYTSSSAYHTCVMLSKAVVAGIKCWGRNQGGQLGMGTLLARGWGPGQMGDFLPAVDVRPLIPLPSSPSSSRPGTKDTPLYGSLSRLMTLGSEHTCGLEGPQVLKCWGLNDAGQLGLGDPANRYNPDNFADLGPQLAVISMAASHHMCAVVTGGKVKCWGDNGRGQLGMGHVVSMGTTTLHIGVNLPFVDLGGGAVAAQVVTGRDFSCALLIGGGVKCWGGNDHGQLGLGDLVARGDEAGELGDKLPLLDFGTSALVLQLSAGDSHVCARFDDYSVRCWGDNRSGQLGIGLPSGRSDSIGDEPFEMGQALQAVDLGTGLSSVRLSAGGHFTCATLNNRRVKCWGDMGGIRLWGPQAGAMGDSLPSVDLGRDAFGQPLGVSDIQAGADFACAVMMAGGAKCWGRNIAGVLGRGNYLDVGDDLEELGEALPLLDLGSGLQLRQLWAGSLSRHACALLSNATSSGFKCWGLGARGQLGVLPSMSRGAQPGQMGDALPFLRLKPPATLPAVRSPPPAQPLSAAPDIPPVYGGSPPPPADNAMPSPSPPPPSPPPPSPEMPMASPFPPPSTDLPGALPSAPPTGSETSPSPLPTPQASPPPTPQDPSPPTAPLAPPPQTPLLPLPPPPGVPSPLLTPPPTPPSRSPPRSSSPPPAPPTRTTTPASLPSPQPPPRQPPAATPSPPPSPPSPAPLPPLPPPPMPFQEGVPSVQASVLMTDLPEASFSPKLQLAFQRGMAAFATLPADSVFVTAVDLLVASSSLRSLRQSGADSTRVGARMVTGTVAAANTLADRLRSSSAAGAVQRAFQDAGLLVTVLKVDVVRVSGMETVPKAANESKGHGALIGGVVGGVVGALVLSAAVVVSAMRYRRWQRRREERFVFMQSNALATVRSGEMRKSWRSEKRIGVEGPTLDKPPFINSKALGSTGAQALLAALHTRLEHTTVAASAVEVHVDVPDNMIAAHVPDAAAASSGISSSLTPPSTHLECVPEATEYPPVCHSQTMPRHAPAITSEVVEVEYPEPTDGSFTYRTPIPHLPRIAAIEWDWPSRPSTARYPVIDEQGLQEDTEHASGTDGERSGTPRLLRSSRSAHSLASAASIMWSASGRSVTSGVSPSSRNQSPMWSTSRANSAVSSTSPGSFMQSSLWPPSSRSTPSPPTSVSVRSAHSQVMAGSERSAASHRPRSGSSTAASGASRAHSQSALTPERAGPRRGSAGGYAGPSQPPAGPSSSAGTSEVSGRITMSQPSDKRAPRSQSVAGRISGSESGRRLLGVESEGRRGSTSESTARQLRSESRARRTSGNESGSRRTSGSEHGSRRTSGADTSSRRTGPAAEAGPRRTQRPEQSPRWN